MEQGKNSASLDLLQALTAQTQPPKTGDKDKADSDFRKLMD